MAAFFAKTTVRIAIGIAAALLVWWLVATLMDGKRAKVEAELNRNVAESALESGKDAVGTVGAQQAKEAASDAVGRENSASIHAAPGADAKVDPGVKAARLKALCRRASTQGDPRCAKP